MNQISKHRGTFGGSVAAHHLDEKLCQINNPKLIKAISKILSMWNGRARKIALGIIDESLFCDVMRREKDDFLDKVKHLDLSKFVSEEKDKLFILTRCNNCILTTYRKILREKLKDFGREPVNFDDNQIGGIENAE